ncbi:hypothetical protein D3C80_2060600 [compost metagenome]
MYGLSVQKLFSVPAGQMKQAVHGMAGRKLAAAPSAPYLIHLHSFEQIEPGEGFLLRQLPILQVELLKIVCTKLRQH